MLGLILASTSSIAVASAVINRATFSPSQTSRSTADEFLSRMNSSNAAESRSASARARRAILANDARAECSSSSSGRCFKLHGYGLARASGGERQGDGPGGARAWGNVTAADVGDQVLDSQVRNRDRSIHRFRSHGQRQSISAGRHQGVRYPRCRATAAGRPRGFDGGHEVGKLNKANPGQTSAAALISQEGQQVGVDGVGLCRRHAVRETLVGFQGALAQQLCRQGS